MQRLFRGEKYLSGLYENGTFRKDFLPRNKIWATRTGPILISRQAGMDGLSRVENALWTVHSSTFRGHFFARDRPVA